MDNIRLKSVIYTAWTSIALALSACGGGDSAPPATITPNPDPPTTATPTPDPAPAPAEPDFSAVTAAIEAHSDDNFAVIIGTVDGEVYSYTKGIFPLEEQYQIASASKWLTSSTIMRLVERGAMSLSDRPQDYLAFWTDDAMDPRSRITLEQLLSFTSGFNQQPGSLGCTPALTVTLQQCVEQVYADGIDTDPGSNYSYGPEHMQIAAAMAERATGTPFAELLVIQIAQPLGLSDATGFVSPTQLNPLASGGGASSPRDYALFLEAMLKGEIVSDLDTFLTDRIPNTPILFRPQASGDFGDWHYALGAFVECDQPVFDSSCSAQMTYSSPGSFGWTPWIDRRTGYWGLIARRGARNTAEVAVELQQELQPLIEEALAQ
ncbi:serine hydrolase domain-containing protein [Qipengyuania sp. DGS5-3]|uniref:serine hydrolase domain-containing protein n=1 Tax=Qipengyuania sp. DGS5-3 TaxID=3349632 RepID=UPI0036D249B0